MDNNNVNENVNPNSLTSKPLDDLTYDSITNSGSFKAFGESFKFSYVFINTTDKQDVWFTLNRGDFYRKEYKAEYSVKYWFDNLSKNKKEDFNNLKLYIDKVIAEGRFTINIVNINLIEMIFKLEIAGEDDLEYHTIKMTKTEKDKEELNSSEMLDIVATHTKEVQKDMLVSFVDIVKKHQGDISEECKADLVNKFSDLLENKPTNQSIQELEENIVNRIRVIVDDSVNMIRNISNDSTKKLSTEITNNANRVNNNVTGTSNDIIKNMNTMNKSLVEISKMLVDIPKELYNIPEDVIRSNITTHDKLIFTVNHLKQIQKTNKIQFRRIFSTYENGDESLKFHEKCDKIGPTFIVFKTDKKLVSGGFTTVLWDKDVSSYSKGDANSSFLFSVDTQKILKHDANVNTLYYLQ